MQRYVAFLKYKDSESETEKEFDSFFDLVKFVKSVDETLVDYFVAYCDDKVIANDFIDMTYIAHQYLRENALAAVFS